MIRVGIGGWTFEPWRGTFFPPDLKKADELRYASRRLGTIEINGTFYRTQSPASFRKWRDDTPDDFVFSVKGHRAIVSSRKLAECGEAIGWFFGSGVLELADKLGPIFWQFTPYRRFDRDDLGAFLTLLPTRMDGRSLRHVVEVRHDSFLDQHFVNLLRDHGVAVAYVDCQDRPAIADPTADFVYARLERCEEAAPTGYAPEALDLWAARARVWAAGGVPDDLPTVGDRAASGSPRPVFIYLISGAKVRAPAAAVALIERLGGAPAPNR